MRKFSLKNLKTLSKRVAKKVSELINEEWVVDRVDRQFRIENMIQVALIDHPSPAISIHSSASRSPIQMLVRGADLGVWANLLSAAKLFAPGRRLCTKPKWKVSKIKSRWEKNVAVRAEKKSKWLAKLWSQRHLRRSNTRDAMTSIVECEDDKEQYKTFRTYFLQLLISNF